LGATTSAETIRGIKGKRKPISESDEIDDDDEVSDIKVDVVFMNLQL